MKIAILSYEFPPETGFGGIGTYAYNHARGLAKIGCDVHVIAGSVHPHVVDYHHDDGFWITRAQLRYRYRMFLEGALRKWLILFSIRLENAIMMSQQLRRLHREKRFDLVEMPECGAEGFLINRFFPDLAKCMKFHSPSYFISQYYPIGKIDHELVGWLEKSAIKRAGFYSAPSHYLADSVSQFFKLKKPVPVIPYGFDFSRVDECPPQDIRTLYGIPRDHSIVAYTSRVEKRKGADLFEKVIPAVLERHPKTHFILAGRYDEQPWLREGIEREVGTAGGMDRLVFTGRVDRTQIINILKQSDVFFHPSRWENLPNSVIEAMACGCCVVASRVGGIPEMVEDGVSGSLVEVDDAKGFSDAIRRMLDEPELRRRFGSAAGEKARSRYDYVRVAEQALAFYQSQLGRAPITSSEKLDR